MYLESFLQVAIKIVKIKYSIIQNLIIIVPKDQGHPKFTWKMDVLKVEYLLTNKHVFEGTIFSRNLFKQIFCKVQSTYKARSVEKSYKNQKS